MLCRLKILAICNVFPTLLFGQTAPLLSPCASKLAQIEAAISKIEEQVSQFLSRSPSDSNGRPRALIFGRTSQGVPSVSITNDGGRFIIYSPDSIIEENTFALAESIPEGSSVDPLNREVGIRDTELTQQIIAEVASSDAFQVWLREVAAHDFHLLSRVRIQRAPEDKLIIHYEVSVHGIVRKFQITTSDPDIHELVEHLPQDFSLSIGY